MSQLPIDYRNIEANTSKNSYYRRVIFTIPNQFQLVLMSLEPGESIPFEEHEDTVQFFRIESGHGVARILIGDKIHRYSLHSGISLTIPQGYNHEIRNTSFTESLQFYTIYTPPTHGPNVYQIRQ